MAIFEGIISAIRNHQNNQDYSGLQDDFLNLNKALEKSKQLVEQDGIPKIYYKGLVMIEDAINESNKEKLSTLQNRACNTLKNKLKKHNRDYEQELADYRKNPIESDEEKEDEEDKENKPKKKEKDEDGDEDKEDDDEDDESKDEDDDDEDDDNDDDDEGEEKATIDRSKMTPAQRRLKVNMIIIM